MQNDNNREDWSRRAGWREYKTKKHEIQIFVSWCIDNVTDQIGFQ